MEKRLDTLKLCEEYIHQIWCIESMKDGGMFAVYGLEQHRIKLHDKLCDMLEIDHEKSKDILSYLDEKIGLNFSSMPSESDLKNYAEMLLDLLLKEKEFGSIWRWKFDYIWYFWYSHLCPLSVRIMAQMLTNVFPSIQTEPPVSTDTHHRYIVHVLSPPL